MVLALCLLVGCNSTTEDNLKEQVKAYNLELTRLNDINQELSISIEGMESEIELLEDSILGYDDDIQALKTENIIYEDEVSQYQSEIIDLSASLDRIKDYVYNTFIDSNVISINGIQIGMTISEVEEVLGDTYTKETMSESHISLEYIDGTVLNFIDGELDLAFFVDSKYSYYNLITIGSTYEDSLKYVSGLEKFEKVYMNSENHFIFPDYEYGPDGVLGPGPDSKIYAFVIGRVDGLYFSNK